MDIIPIAILASDPITWEGSVALLSAHPDLLILPPELRPYARILLVITPAVTETVLRDMEGAQAATCCRWLRIVMAADHVKPRDFLRASPGGAGPAAEPAAMRLRPDRVRDQGRRRAAARRGLADGNCRNP